MASTNVTSAGENREPSRDELLKENEELNSKLKAYKSLEEELMAQKVFENAKKKLTVWLTVGGLGTVIVGLIGFKQIEDYTQKPVKEKADTVIEQRLSDQIEQHVSATVAAKEPYINSTIIAVVGRYVAGSQQLTGAVAATPGAASVSLVVDTTKATLDYTASMTPARDQGQEGGAVGFAVAAALEYQIFKKTNKQLLISPRYIYYVARKNEGTSKADSGARMADAIKALTADGAVAEEAWPYKSGEFADVPPKTVANAERYRPTATQKLKSIDDVKAALQKYGPVVAGIAVYTSFESDSAARTGHIPDPSPKDSVIGGGAICIVGYDDQKKVFKFKNSWGTGWGDHGYGYISYSYFEKLSDDNWLIVL